jgi:hypothetical protein
MFVYNGNREYIFEFMNAASGIELFLTLKETCQIYSQSKFWNFAQKGERGAIFRQIIFIFNFIVCGYSSDAPSTAHK